MIFMDNFYAFSVSPNGILHVFSLSLAIPLCSVSIHNGASNQLCVYTRESQNYVSKINRKQDYFILSFSRQDRLMSFYLFNDHSIPLKSIVRQVKGNRFSFKDYSSVALVKIALLFIPCNSTIQPDSCSLCRKHQSHTHNMSDFFVFQDKSVLGMNRGNKEMGFSDSISSLNLQYPGSVSNCSVDDLDLFSSQLGVMLYRRPTSPANQESVPLVTSSQNCWVCNNPVTKTKISKRMCCCQSIEHLVVTPQSLMPTSFSQDCSIQCHLPPSSLTICNNCLNAIICGHQTLSPSELTMSPGDRESWTMRSYTPFERSQRSQSTRSGGIPLSVLLAHIGHNVDDLSLDEDFSLTIHSWNEKDGKRPDAFRIYLQLTDMVMIWYDVLVKDIRL